MMTLEDQIALRSLIRNGRLAVGKQISSKRARSLITLGFAGPACLEPLAAVIEATQLAYDENKLRRTE
jgi:hypothetical protein